MFFSKIGIFGLFTHTYPAACGQAAALGHG
jgi:hypothetical protein